MRQYRKLALVSAAAASAMLPTVASYGQVVYPLKGGTAAGTSINNTASATYSVGGVPLTNPVVSNVDTIVVDRRVNLLVSESGANKTTVTPGQLKAVTTFTLTNNSNDTLDFVLAAANAAAATDQFDVDPSISIFRDTNANGTYESGTDVAVTRLSNIAADAVVTLFVVSDIPATKAANATLVTGDEAIVYLRATAYTAGGGAIITQTAGANNKGTVDNVFADVAGSDDATRDGMSSARDTYRISAVALTLTKSSYVYSDPVNGVSANAKAIPGAVVRYCIAVGNAAGGADATNVALTDTLNSNLTTVTNSVRVGGATGGDPTICNYDGTPGGSTTANSVSATIASILAGQIKTVWFEATIN